jgi:hypothetical protein
MTQPIANRVQGDCKDSQTMNVHSNAERWDGRNAAYYYLPLKILLARTLVNATMVE